jgi:mono/diheme cytochrome c family protein
MVLTRIGFIAFLLFLVACEADSKTCSDCKDDYSMGQYLYEKQCTACHGADGKLGNSGAKDLTQSILTEVEIREILNEGKGAMPAQIELIANPDEMDSVIQYIQKFRK